jgi:hypothetical protein
VRKIDSRTVGPFAAIGKDSRKVKTNINQRWKAIEQTVDGWQSRSTFRRGRMARANETQQLFCFARKIEQQK